jgi:uncharacterized membrane protein|tara:strand:- start:305 stop:553 length:249 start_codon:yes stop_codon:yes gene_type:complete
MEFNDKFFIELFASFAAILTVWVYGNRSRKAPLIGMVGQMLWWWLTISQSMWGLIPLNVVMLIIHVRNYIKMKREDDIRSQL